ncbi:MAG: hypothetical protein GXP24_08095 [Planctomycetes bacterium]|nr:hypothetical protein [Planctomycetota bacterium]
MKVSVKLGVEIDVCTPCSVVWLDRGELEHVCDNSAFVSSAMNQLVDSITRTTSLSCPTCNDKKLSSVSVVGTNLSVCVECQGILLKAATLRWFRERKQQAKQRKRDRNVLSEENDPSVFPIIEILYTVAEIAATFIH